MRKLLLALALAFNVAFAQETPDNLEPLPESAVPSPSPTLPFDDPSLEPEITIREQAGQTIEEYSIAGRIYAIKVTPKHGVPYYLIDVKGDGNFSRYDGPGENIQVPLWVIHEF